MQMMGKKRGMTQIFDAAGNPVVCTVIQAEPNVVVQIKRKVSDGYDALQLGFDKIKTEDPRTVEKRIAKQQLGHFRKANVAPCRHLSEVRVSDVEAYSIGQEITVGCFADISFVDVCGVSKGKGYQGPMKRWGHAGGPAAHGSGFHRHGGSMGQRTTPGRTFPGFKKAGRMGGERVTVQSLRVVCVDEGRNLIVVEGAVPGRQGGLVYVAPAEKKQKSNKK